MFDINDWRSAVRSDGQVSRRLLLAYGSALAALPMLATRVSAANRRPTFSANPFSLGVASGDPDTDSVVLWTKLAPVATDPDGGMKNETVEVTWELASDDSMKTVVARGKAYATPALGHSIHVEATGLQPDRWYWYRFHAGDATSPIGRTRTLPARDAEPRELRFAFASCQNYEQGYYTAYEQMARDQLDLVFHLGDYIYEYPGREKAVRRLSGPKDGRLKTLADYRERHMLYRTDTNLAAMHAQCPWFVTWDDHEFENNYADDIAEIQRNRPTVDPIVFLEQRAAAYQAYYEMMPLRPRSLPHGPDMLLYRKASFGRLADFFVLDTRQYRTDQPNNDRLSPLNDNATQSTNTLLGRQQRGWLQAGLLESISTWNVLAQQVMMAMVEVNYGVVSGYSMDQWPGYAHERMALLRFMAERKVSNPVVLTGDIHSNWANELRIDDRRQEMPIVATEFVGTSISSGGKGVKNIQGLDKLMSTSPHVRFHNRERGYVRCTVTPSRWQSDYVVAEDVTQPNAPVVKRASFVVEAGRPKLESA